MRDAARSRPTIQMAVCAALCFAAGAVAEARSEASIWHRLQSGLMAPAAPIPMDAYDCSQDRTAEAVERGDVAQWMDGLRFAWREYRKTTAAGQAALACIELLDPAGGDLE
jgi:hypothetical protein